MFSVVPVRSASRQGLFPLPRPTLPTAPVSIYRFRAGLPLRDYLDVSEETSIKVDAPILIAEVRAHVIAGVRTTSNPDWAKHFRQITNLEVALAGSAPFAVILVPIDQWVCAVTWGTGRYLLDDVMADDGFGLAFGIRRLDPAKLRTVNSSLLDISARVTQKSFPSGSPLVGFGVESAGELVNGLRGPANVEGLTYHDATNGKQCSIRAGNSLAIQIGKSAEDFIADLREICRIADESDADSPLRFITQVRPLATNDPRLAGLERRLATALGGDDQFGPLGLCWPTAASNVVEEANSFDVVGLSRRDGLDLTDDLAIEAITRYFADVPLLARVAELKNGRLAPCEDENGQNPLTRPISLHKWIAFETSVDHSTFCLHQGRWYEIGQDTVARVRAEAAALMTNKSSLVFAHWTPTRKQDDEQLYCTAAAGQQPGCLCLDRNLARTPMHPKFELADIVGPLNELVHVKWLGGAAAASHLFTQARVSAWSLRFEPEALQQLDAKVHQLDSHRHVDERPQTVVLAAAGRRWQVTELFTLSLIGLLRLNDDLRYLGFDLQFADIPFSPKQKKSRGSASDQAA